MTPSPVAARVLARTVGFAFLAAALVSPPAFPAGRSLEEGFVSPGDSAKPHTWWHWMNGNISKEGITRDLEEMKRVGIGGAQIFDVTDGIPPGPVTYMSAQWRDMVKHAVREAHRLGLELCIHNCAGWSSSGGPWVEPRHAMQIVVVSEVRVGGPRGFADILPKPATKLNHYRDIAVLAFPTPAAEGVRMSDANPTAIASVPDFDADKLVDGDTGTRASVQVRSSGPPPYVELQFPQPFAARSLTVVCVSRRNGQQCTLQVSEDGVAFDEVAAFALPDARTEGSRTTVPLDPVSARFYRILFSKGRARGTLLALAEIALEPDLRIANLQAKAGYVRADNPAPDTRLAGPDALIRRDDILDLTERVDADGRLLWDVPEGDWTILRIGHTPTGKDNHPAPEEGRGPECDKLSREAAEAHFAGMLGHVIEDIGPLAGQTLKHVLIDSYEVGAQNWTPLFREEFRTRRGYDPLLYLPVMTGRVVDSVETSERFLWDLRRTIADLFADNYFGHYATMCHRHGIELSVEPYGNGGFDNLTCGGRADIPMSEFWAGSGNDNQSAKQAASAAHTYGRKVVGAEAFTASPERGGWRNHPYALKALGDLIYCGGVNRFVFHRYAHQPWPDLRPGMTMGPHGFHFEHTVTWWDQSPAWLAYLSRCQYLLQEGVLAADLCYLRSEGAPNHLPARRHLTPAPPPGYDYDGCSAEVVLSRMSVRDGRIVLPDGMSYRLLMLPRSDAMTPRLLRRISALVRDGATVVGPRPTRAPGLQDYPDADTQVQALAEALFGPCDGRTVTEHAFGQGKIVWGKPIEEVLIDAGLQPDFQASAPRKKPQVEYIHRIIGEVEAYFISNQKRSPQEVDCTFRVTGRIPELWHPDTGAIERVPVYRERDGRTTVPLRLDPAGSVFVVFRAPAAGVDHAVSFQRDGESVFHARPRSVPDLAIRAAVYGVLSPEPPDVVDVTAQLAALVREGALTVRADNSIAGDPAQGIVKQLWVEYVLDGRAMTKMANEGRVLQIPEEAGEPGGVLAIRRAIYGVLPDLPPPAIEDRTADVTVQLAAMIEEGALSVVASNALAGDPAPLVVKQLRVDYTLDGEPYTRIVNEGQSLEIPDGTETGRTPVVMPAADLSVSPDGASVLTAWEAGTYRVATASGKILTREIAGIPGSLEVSGPWELRFPPDLGAPERATFQRLITWTEHDDPGIKYFSGTATYLGQFDIPAELLGRGKALVLDLGVVREIAQVRLNERDLGVLWKPPFRVDISARARPGRNLLEVRVTNLWPNRLIGDEQLEDDRDWSPGRGPRGWPAWLVAGEPRPDDGRVTFTTWQHHHRSSPLLPSGLLGPVTLRSGRVVDLIGP